MPRTKNGTPPSYRRHSSGQACVTVREAGGRRREILLGEWNSPQSKEEYARVLAQIAAHNGTLPLKNAPGLLKDLSIAELMVEYLRFAEQYYRTPEGDVAGEFSNVKEAMKPLRRLFGRTKVGDFDSLCLEALQNHLVQEGRLARSTINARINRIRRLFRWAVRKKLVPASVLTELETVPGLQFQRSGARETSPVKAVAWHDVEAILPFLPPVVAAMVRLQWLTGCRVSEVASIRASDVSTQSDVWIYEPATHKNAWRGKSRRIYLGPQAQKVLKPYIDAHPEGFVFRPSDVVESLHAGRKERRVTRKTPSQRNRTRKVNPKRVPGERYDRKGYRQAIVRACRRAQVSCWTPLQLRHGRATEIRRQYGLEAGQCVLGHERADVTQIYAERNEDLALNIMKKVG